MSSLISAKKQLPYQVKHMNYEAYINCYQADKMSSPVTGTAVIRTCLLWRTMLKMMLVKREASQSKTAKAIPNRNLCAFCSSTVHWKYSSCLQGTKKFSWQIYKRFLTTIRQLSCHVKWQQFSIGVIDSTVYTWTNITRVR